MANERGRLTDTDGATVVLLNDTATKTKIIREETDLQGGLVKKPVPLSRSASALHEAVWGRSRMITIEGIKMGTQGEIESFIKTLDDWVNATGMGTNFRYYPLFHKNNTAGAGSQNKYYLVLADSFNTVAEVRDVGYILHYTLVLFEGKKIVDFIS